MTTRLKLLSALLCVSIVYAVYDYIDRNSVENTTRVKKKKIGVHEPQVCPHHQRR